MEKNKEKWMTEVLNANEELKELPLSKHLLTQLYNIPRLITKNDNIEWKTLLYVAASVLIILGINLFSWFSNQLVQFESSTDATQYFNYLNHF